MKSYNNALERYVLFCRDHGLKSFIENTSQENWNIFDNHWGRGDGCRLVVNSVEMFIANLADQQKTFSTIETYVAGLKSYSKDVGEEKDLNNNRMKKLMEGIHKTLGDKTKLTRTPFTPLMLDKLEEYVNSILYSKKNKNLPFSTHYNCLLLMACVTFALGGAFRGSEFLSCSDHRSTQSDDSKLNLKQIDFYDGDGRSLDSQTILSQPDVVKSLHVNLKQTKTDIYKKGHKVIITHNRVISWFIKYFRVRPTFGSSMVFLTQHGFGFGVRPFVELVHEYLLLAGFTAKEVEPIMGHSFRIGAAQILRDANVSTHQLMEYGRWQSDAHNIYHKGSMKEKERLNTIVMQSKQK